MDEAKAYFLKHTKLNYVDMTVWGQTQGQTPQHSALTHSIKKGLINALKLNPSQTLFSKVFLTGLRIKKKKKMACSDQRQWSGNHAEFSLIVILPQSKRRGKHDSLDDGVMMVLHFCNP